MSPRTHPNDEPARSDKAILAAEDAVWAIARERAGAGGFEALGPVEVTRIAVEAARPIIAAEQREQDADNLETAIHYLGPALSGAAVEHLASLAAHWRGAVVRTTVDDA